MDLPSLLPHVNASLNATAMILLGYARVMIAQRQIDRHLRRRDSRHRAIARWTWPVWMYVSVSGVVVYLLLYQIYR